MMGFIEIFCKRCGRRLAITLPTADAYCPSCMGWTLGRKKCKSVKKKVNTDVSTKKSSKIL